MNIGAVTINVRFLVHGKDVPMWRLKVVAWVTKALGVPIEAVE